MERPVVPLSRDKKKSCPVVALSRDKGRSKNLRTNSYVPGHSGTKSLPDWQKKLFWKFVLAGNIPSKPVLVLWQDVKIPPRPITWKDLSLSLWTKKSHPVGNASWTHCLDLDLNGLLTRRNFWRVPGMLGNYTIPKWKEFLKSREPIWENPTYPLLST